MTTNSVPTDNSLTQQMSTLGFRPVNPFHLLNSITQAFSTLIGNIFAWVYFLSEVCVLAGASIWIVGGLFHHNRIKQAGAHTVLYAIIGFLAAVLLPGVIVAINNQFHHL